MDFSAVALTEAQQEFRDEVRAFLAEHLTAQGHAEMVGQTGDYFARNSMTCAPGSWNTNWTAETNWPGRTGWAC
jgi:hypothetical protein